MTDWESSSSRRRRHRPLVAAVGLALLGLGAAISIGREGLAPDLAATPPDPGLAVDHDAEPPPEPAPDPEGPTADGPDEEGGSEGEAAADQPGPQADPIGEWRRLPPAPLPPGEVTASAWTGEELLVWGGQADQLAAYDPDRDEWRRAADAPVFATGRTGTVWTGEELVVVGAYAEGGEAGRPDHAAAYRPDTDAWRQIATPPRGDWAWDMAVWDGAAVVVLGARYSQRAQPDAVAYDPARDAWEALPPPPVSNWGGRLLTAAVDGHVVAIGERPAAPADDGERELTAYDPLQQAWTDPEPTPYGGLWSVGMAAVERAGEVAVIGAVHDDIWHDVTATWSPQDGLRWNALPARPFSGQHAPILIDTGHGLVAWPLGSEEAWLLDEAEGGWRPLAPGPLGGRADFALAWTGRELLVWGGRMGQTPRGDGAAWRPASPASPQ